MNPLPPFPRHLSPEAQVLLASVGVQNETERYPFIRQITGQSSIDWDFLMDAAEHNRVVPLLYSSLEKARAQDVSQGWMERLRDSCRYTLAWNLLMTQELVTILRLLDRESIPALPYKGLLLADSLYRDVSLRQVWDLDILIQNQDVDRAKQLVLNSGYQLNREVSPDAEMKFLEEDCEYTFVNSDTGVAVELHWRVLPRVIWNKVHPDSIWEKATRISVWGTTAFTLPPEELYLIVFLHDALKHHWTELKQVSDVARVLEVHPEMNWERFFEPISQTRFERSVLVGFLLAHVLLGACLPEAIESRIESDPVIGDFTALAVGRLFRPGFGLPSFSEWTNHVEALSLDRNPSSSAAMRTYSFPRYLRAVMTPEFRDRYALSTVSPKLLFLQHLFRPARLLRQHGFRLLNRI